MRSLVVTSLVICLSFNLPGFGKTSKELSCSILGSPNLQIKDTQTPQISGIWQGQGSNDGQTYSVKLEVQQEGESITGVLTSSGSDGTIVHNIKGTYDKKLNKYICEDTSVSKVTGQLGLSPTAVSHYEISTVDDGQKLVGWAKINRNSKAWFDLTKSDDQTPASSSYQTEAGTSSAPQSEPTISEPIMPQAPTQSSASTASKNNNKTLSGLWSGTCKGNDPSMSVTLELRQDGDAITGSWESKGKSGKCKRYIRGSYDKYQDAFICRDIGFDFSSPATGWHHCLIDKYEIHEVNNGQKLIGTYISSSAHDKAWFSLQRKEIVSTPSNVSTNRINRPEQNKTPSARTAYSQSPPRYNTSPQHAPSELSINELEQYAFRLINRDRIKNGNQPLTFDYRLSKIAQDYAEYMIANNHFGHIDLDGHNGQYRAQQAGITCSVDDNFTLEPRATISDDLAILNKVEKSFMVQQPNQRNQHENIMAPDHRYVGIGIARSQDRLVMVQEFARANPGAGNESAANTYSQPLENIPQNITDSSSNFSNTNNCSINQSSLSNSHQSYQTSSYMAYITRTLKSHWHVPSRGQSRIVVVNFNIHRDGSVSDVSVDPGQGNDEDIQAAIDAIKAAAPLQPPDPTVFSNDSNDVVSIRFSFTYNRYMASPYGPTSSLPPGIVIPFANAPTSGQQTNQLEHLLNDIDTPSSWSKTPVSGVSPGEQMSLVQPAAFNYFRPPYNGSPGYFANATARGIYRWTREKLPIKVFIADGRGVPGYRDFFYAALVDAFNQWMWALNNRLAWQLVPNESNADVVCTWTDSRSDFQLHKFTEQGETQLQQMPLANNPNEFFISHATIKICTKLMFGIRPLIGNEVNNTCIHEVGHALGLNGHSPHWGDVMFPCSAPTNLLYGGAPLERLSSRDIATINYLYASY